MPLLPSSWGFSTLGHGVSPRSRSSATQLLLQGSKFCSCYNTRLYTRSLNLMFFSNLYWYVPNKPLLPSSLGLPRWLSGKESACQCRRCGSIHAWFRKIPWKRRWQPTPVFLPGKSHGQKSLGAYSPWNHKRVRHDLVTQQE